MFTNIMLHAVVGMLGYICLQYLQETVFDEMSYIS